MTDYREDNKWTVYIHTVPKELSGYEFDKHYIGITCKKVEDRWGVNGHRYKGQVFYNAIEKYGWENIQHEVLVQNLTQEDACRIEKSLIKKFNSNNFLFGYNMDDGGLGGNHKETFPVSQYDLFGNYIATFEHSEAAATHVGASNGSWIRLCCIGEARSCYGYQWRYKDDDPPGKYIKHNTRQVDQYDLNGNFLKSWDSIKSITDYYGFSKNTVINCCSHRSKSGGGFIWKYSNDSTKLELAVFSKKIMDINSKKIYQFTLDNKFIKEWENVGSIVENTGYSKRNITDCCNKKYQSSHGFKWRYIEDVDLSTNIPLLHEKTKCNIAT